jgi:Thioredoxin-like [2Fe-2S] ferredoxin
MSDRYQTSSFAVEGWFMGWADDRYPHRRLRILTDRGEQVMKIVKSLSTEIQDWQPGINVSLWCQQRVNVVKGKTKIKIEGLLDRHHRDLNLPTLDLSPPVQTIRVCQGSTCCKRGSERVCQAIATYLEEHDLTDRVQIQPVKCLHECKTAPHAIFAGEGPRLAVDGGLSHRYGTHYPRLTEVKIAKIMAYYFPDFCASQTIERDLLDRLSHLTCEFV